MSDITSNISLTLDGSTSFTVGGDPYQWFDRGLGFLNVSASGAVRTITLTFSNEGWKAGVLRFDGDTRLVLNDTSTGTSDDDRVFISYIGVASMGTHSITLKNADVDLVHGGSGSENVSIGYWVGHLNLNRGDDKVTLTGTGEAGDISFGRGDDILKTGSNGWVGTVNAAHGEDTVYLGKRGAEYINLGKDADTIVLKPLSDPFQPVSLNGGEGVTDAAEDDSDTVSFAAFSAGLTIDLNGQYVVRTGSGNFSLNNFENATGGKGRDTLIANDEANLLKGGRGADTFVFESRAAIKGDTILDFSQDAKDRIDLSDIDASTKAGGNQAFSFIGTAGFHDQAGELRYLVKSGDTRIQGDVNGDGKADFTLVLEGRVDLEAGDFIL